jgi:L-lactate dehydrogenase complex protein LldG
MSSRFEILSKIKSNKPAFLGLPDIDLDKFNEDINLLDKFIKMIEEVGGKVLTSTSNKDLFSQINNLFPGFKIRYSILKDSASFNTIQLKNIKRPQELEGLDLLILEGLFGVSENGAIWISDNEVPIRVLPFITKHLILVLDKTKIVSNMHKAYELLSVPNDYGLFISGPSKTADIEQSLVIGAQGALSLTVFLK